MPGDPDATISHVPTRPFLTPTRYRLDPASSPYFPKWIPVYERIQPGPRAVTDGPHDWVMLDTEGHRRGRTANVFAAARWTHEED